jgi:hypothetical protein
VSAAPSTQLVQIECACGVVHRFSAKHYEVARTECGRFYWSLAPKRDGRLKLFPWPGPNLTREQMTGQKSAEQIVKGMNK